MSRATSPTAEQLRRIAEGAVRDLCIDHASYALIDSQLRDAFIALLVRCYELAFRSGESYALGMLIQIAAEQLGITTDEALARVRAAMAS